jgi:hypothetical protein
MQHHVIYRRMAKREADVDDSHLCELLHEEERGETFVEFLDGRRRPLTWDADRHGWLAAETLAQPAA